MSNETLTPIHPGEVLLEVYLKPSSPPLTVAALSQALGETPEQVNDFIQGKRDVTQDLAERLGLLCWTTTDYWLDLQRVHDREAGRRSVLRLPRPHKKRVGRKAAA